MLIINHLRHKVSVGTLWPIDVSYIIGGPDKWRESLFCLSGPFYTEIYVVFIKFSDNQLISFWCQILVLAALLFVVLRGCDSTPQTPLLLAMNALGVGSRFEPFVAVVRCKPIIVDSNHTL